MNVVRAFPLMILALALSACAGKPARSDAPVADTVVPAATPAAYAGTVDAAPAAAMDDTTATPPPATNAGADSETDVATTSASALGGDDHFDALYGNACTSATTSAYDPW